MLSRAINYMEANGLEAVFPNYTTYTYEGGTVMACTQEENGLKLTIQLPGGENRTISVSSSALLVQDGAKTTGQNIMAGAFARIRYTAADKKTVQSVWLLSSPKTAEGTAVSYTHLPFGRDPLFPPEKQYPQQNQAAAPQGPREDLLQCHCSSFSSINWRRRASSSWLSFSSRRKAVKNSSAEP